MPLNRSDHYHDLDLHANQLLNSRVHNITTANRVILGGTLGLSDKGYQVYDTDLSTPYFWDGTQWLAAGGGGGTWGSITGTITAQTDLINYLSTNYYPVTNPAGYITSSALSPYLTSATAASTYVPLTRSLTINGTTYDLSADRTWTINSLPSQATHAGEWLTTDGTNASWSVLSGNVSVFTNDAGYLDQTAADLLYYPLSSNPANYLTSETDPVFTAWLNTPPNISIFNNDSGYITGGDVPTFESDPVFSAWLSSPPNISIFTNDAGYLNYIPTLQQVTTAGATTDKSITISNASGISNPFIKVSDASADAKLYIDILNGKGKLLLQYNNPSISVFDGILQPASLTSSQTWTLPNATGNLTLSVNGQTANANGAITIPVGTGTVTSVTLANGTGISLSGTNPITTSGTITITNSAPDQTVVLSNGTGISTSGTYPNFTITNSAPDQTVVLNNGTGISVTGTYPNFTITNTSPSLGGDMTKAVYDVDNDGLVDTAEKIMIQVLNNTGAAITRGQIVYLKSSSSSASTPEALLAYNTSEATSSKTIGAVYDLSIANGATGYIITNGEMHGNGSSAFDTSMYNVGDKLWLGSTPGSVTTSIPSAPNHAVFIGTVTRSQTTNGRVMYSIQNGFELGELHNVSLTSPPNDNDGLFYENSSSLWKNKSISTVLGYTPQAQLNGTGFVKASGTTISYDSSTYLTSAITSLGGLTGATQTFGDDTNVTMVSSGTTHTLTWSGTLADSRIASASTWNSKIGGSGTTNEIAYFTASGTIGSLTTGTYPSLTELSYVKGVTSAIQTQINNKGYSINFGALQTTLSASTTYYFGMTGIAGTTTANIRRVYIPLAGTIKEIYLYIRSGTTSSENWTVSLRLNNTTNTTIATVGSTSGDKVFSNSNLNVTVLAGDYFEITTTTPAWVTPASNSNFYGTLIIH